MTATEMKGFCGIVRPIATMEGYPAQHWAEVHDILANAIIDAQYQPRLVSESDAAGIILGNIVSNLYSDPIVICDVSGRNPNVMFELGMRIAFEKPVIVVADDTTPFSFDIAPLKHEIYPRTLRFQAINDFKKRIAAAIPATVQMAQGGHGGYLQQFGPIKVTEVGERQISTADVVSNLEDIKRTLKALEVATLENGNSTMRGMLAAQRSTRLRIDLDDLQQGELNELIGQLNRHSNALSTRISRNSEGPQYLVIETGSEAHRENIERIASMIKRSLVENRKQL